MLKKTLIIGFGLGLITQSVQSKLPAFDHYVIFGDSLTDVGNYTTSSNNCIYFNAPITNHPNPENQYTNSTWANAGDFNNTTASNEGGSNYAVAGYTTAQILTSVKNYKINHRGDPDTLYIIWAGTNDVLTAISNHWSDDAVQQTLKDGTNNVFLSLTHLYEIGAKNFLIIGLMDLSQTPLSTFPHTDTQNLLGLFSNIDDKIRLQKTCAKWNATLLFDNQASAKALLKRFKSQHEDSHIYVWDPTPSLSNMIHNPVHYGYPAQLIFNTQKTQLKDAPYPTSQVTYCGNTANLADHNPDHYLFYNFIHPTPSAYRIMQRNMKSMAAELN